ncbi:NAD(P)-dependent oxidoreductase [Antarcticirhabdus aurantiaca]|uniref:NAD(P)-dependent oxidoreductase n=1 Tax=Antarcticirhabdus aurantiaca TaxID=2606717 RepID=A0ACD4NN23_9HYPH|nr:NAD(P)-dependent oxidoreductase [Antarcticirhabdus aurantiaca]WAJ28055.1 NAD(P)-dependent oxidoreductase [Jeongeuplla avenae]
MSNAPVGLLGAGLIGTALARRLLAAGFPVHVFDPDAAKANALATWGAILAPSPEAVARAARRTIVAVFDTDQVESVTEGGDGLAAGWALSPGPVPIAICVSTCDPLRIERLAGRLAARGVGLVECPLSGSSGQVAAGTAAGLVAGADADVAAVDDVLAVLAPRRFRLGPAGNGNRAKLAINLILGLNRAALAEGLVFAQALGLPLDAFLDVARGSAAQSQVMDVKGGKMVSGDFAPEGRVRQSAKDFALIRDAAAGAGRHLPLAALYGDLMAGCIAAGEGEADNAAVIAELRRRSLLPPSPPHKETQSPWPNPGPSTSTPTS